GKAWSATRRPPMRPEEIQRLLRQQPFQPFWLHLSNGHTYDVRHPELVAVGRSTVFIGVPASDLPIPTYDDFAIVALMHINDVKPLPPGPPLTNGPPPYRPDLDHERDGPPRRGTSLPRPPGPRAGAGLRRPRRLALCGRCLPRPRDLGPARLRAPRARRR